MKNLKKVSRQTQGIKSNDRATWIPLYYSIENDAVYTTEGKDRVLVTELINPNTENDIKKAIDRWRWM